MGRRKTRNHIGEPFVPVLKFMLKSEAYKKLTNASRTALLLLQSQVNEFGQKEVVYPYSDASEYMEKRTFTKSIRQLVELGFIEIADFGGLYRRTNVYRFVDNWKRKK